MVTTFIICQFYSSFCYCGILKTLRIKFLLNKVTNAGQTCPRFLLPLGFCIRFFQVLHCNVSDCCSKQQKQENWILCKNWYEKLFVVNFFHVSLEKEWLQQINPISVVELVPSGVWQVLSAL